MKSLFLITAMIDKCLCSAFEDKNMSLQLLAIHQIIYQVQKLLENSANKKAYQICQNKLLNQFTFYIKIVAYDKDKQKFEYFIIKTDFQQLFSIIFPKLKVWMWELVNENEYFKYCHSKFRYINYECDKCHVLK